MERLLVTMIFIILLVAIEFGRAFGAIILPISASLILLICSIIFWRTTFWPHVEKKYNALFLGTVFIYTIGIIFNVLMYN